jgi:hypothetical protein
MSATMDTERSDPGAGRRSGHDHSALLLVAIVTLAMGMGATLLDDGLAAQVPAVMLLVGCTSLSTFIVTRTADRQ